MSLLRLPLPLNPYFDWPVTYYEFEFVLAGRLGFEPRQSAPKALDLPLVDRPKPFGNFVIS